WDRIDQADSCIRPDAVKVDRQSWQQRHRIKGPSGLQWRSVPVVFRGRHDQKIKDVEIREAEFWRRHLRAVEVNYRRAPFFDIYFPQLSAILQAFPAGARLADLILRLLRWLAEVPGVPAPLLPA